MKEWDAAAYDRLADPQTRWGAAVLERVEDDGVDRILDAGCGTGRVTQLVLERFPSATVVAVDASAQMLERAAERLAPFGDRVTFAEVDLQEPFAAAVGGPVDVVFSTATFHWIRDHDRLFANIAEALRPGGQLVAQFGGHGNISTVIDALVALGEPEPRSWTYPNCEEAAARLERAGFRDSRTWLHPEPTPFDDLGTLAEFLATAVIRIQVEAKPVADRAAFARAVAAAMREPVIDYVRCNVVARRA